MIDVAFIFPGQGAQSVGMGKELYDQHEAAQDVFDQANQVINGLTDVVFNGPEDKLKSTAYCQPGIFACSIAALKVLQAHPKYAELNPKFTAGLSLGEYGALTACGALSFEETLKLIERRSFFMEEATKIKKGAMVAVIGFDEDKLVDICQETGAEVANFNSPEQIVITGEAEKVEAACVRIKEQGAKRVIPLEVSGAFHSSLMQFAAKSFKEVLDQTNFNEVDIPLISNVDAVPTTDSIQIKENLAKQITSSVQWIKIVQHMAAQGVQQYFEFGPGNVLKGLIRKINPELTVTNIRKPEDIESFFSNLTAK